MDQRIVKRIIVSTLVILALGVFIYFGLSYYFEQKQLATIKGQSVEFINKWGNFKDETSPDYVASLRPYYTSDYFNIYNNSIVSIQATSETNKYLPTISHFTIITGPEAKKISGNEYTVVIKGHQVLEDVSSGDVTVTLTWDKVGSNFLINNVVSSN